MKTQLIYYRGLAFALAMISTLLSGCAGTRSLYDLVHSPEDAAKAALSHHNALGEAAVAMRSDPTVSEPTKTALRAAYRKTVCSAAEEVESKPTADCKAGPAARTEAAAKAYETLHTATTEAELQNAVDELTAVLIDLIELTKGAK